MSCKKVSPLRKPTAEGGCDEGGCLTDAAVPSRLVLNEGGEGGLTQKKMAPTQTPAKQCTHFENGQKNIWCASREKNGPLFTDGGVPTGLLMDVPE